MTSSEVRKMCEEIDYHAGMKLRPDDEDQFKRLYRRVKDDEDLDSGAVAKLQDIYDRYLRK